MILLGAVEEPLLAFTVLAAYYGVILLHECGHMVVAQRKGCAVSAIDLYPLWGLTHFSLPYSRRDRCVIAWGGVVAQGIVGVPIVVLVEIFGYSRFQPLNAILAIFGFLSLNIAVFNLIPVPPLDGAIAWACFRLQEFISTVRNAILVKSCDRVLRSIFTLLTFSVPNSGRVLRSQKSPGRVGVRPASGDVRRRRR